jgi:hypothetical protein
MMISDPFDKLLFLIGEQAFLTTREASPKSQKTQKRGKGNSIARNDITGKHPPGSTNKHFIVIY